MTLRPSPVPTRPLASLFAAATLVAALLVGLGSGFAASPAGAHEGDAVVTVEAVHPAGLSMHYIVRVTWANDGHPAADATVTATAVGSDGTQLTPVALAPADDDGRYAGVVDYPSAGSWTVRITSIDPTGSIEQAQEVTAPPTTAPSDESSEVTTGSGESEGDATAATEGGFAPSDDGTGASDEQAAADGSDDGGVPIYLIAAAGAVVIIGAATAIGMIRRNRANPPATGSSTTDPTAGSSTTDQAPARASAADPAATDPSATDAP
jgi:hypothetical protein